jgi:hypothetical protein
MRQVAKLNVGNQNSAFYENAAPKVYGTMIARILPFLSIEELAFLISL